MEITEAGVVGAGTMGSGIAQLFAQHAIHVTLVDTSEAALERAMVAMRTSLARLAKKGALGEVDPVVILSRITLTTQFDHLKNCQIVAEAITENPAAKETLFHLLSECVSPTAILATNTSSLSLTQIAAWCSIPERVIGMHFMNPVAIMPLVEVIRALQTSDATWDTVHQLAKQLGKTPVLVNDSPGFVSNRILMPMINEAIFCLYEGLACAEDIDNVMKMGMNHPIGPLALADLIGLDTCLSIMDILYQAFRDSKYRACPLLVKMVSAGQLGRKTQQGFYHY